MKSCSINTLSLPILVLLLSACVIGCNESKSSDQIQRKKQEQLSLQGTQSVGMPAITNFAEKRMMKDIIEMRDQNVATITYLVGMNNQLRKLCTSVGFGLPYSTQYTNPSKVWVSGGGSNTQVIPQADPNGLFSPPAAEGTWVACLNPETKKVTTVYVEPRIIVSPFPLE